MALAKNFGTTGDGQTDDTLALQHAIDDGDGLVELSRGTYRITKTLRIDLTKQGFRGISGHNGTARIVMTAPGPALHVIGDHQGTAAPQSFRPHTWEKERFPVLSGFEIVGQHEQADGIRLQKTMQCTIHAVLIRRCRYGIHLVERNRNFLLANSHIYHGRAIGVFFDAVNLHQINIIGNHISYNPVAGIKLLGGEVRDLQITGNDIEYNDDHPDGSADLWIDTSQQNATMRELTVTGNTIQGHPAPNGANIRIVGQPCDAADRSGLAAITGNLIGSQTTNIHLKHTRGIVISGNAIYSGAQLSIHAQHCRHVVVGANTFDHNPGQRDQYLDGIRFENCADCSVTGAVLEDARYPDGALSMKHCTDCAVTGCQILDPEHAGLTLTDCSRCRVSDNAILDRRTPPRMKSAIRLTGNSAKNLVQNNMIQPGTLAAVAAKPDAATQQGNMIL